MLEAKECFLLLLNYFLICDHFYPLENHYINEIVNEATQNYYFDINTINVKFKISYNSKWYFKFCWSNYICSNLIEINSRPLEVIWTTQLAWTINIFSSIFHPISLIDNFVNICLADLTLFIDISLQVLLIELNVFF